jgi:hypothetical protein
MFKLAFIHLVHFSTSGLSSMVFEHLKNLFDPKDLANKLSQLFLCVFMLLQGVSPRV